MADSSDPSFFDWLNFFAKILVPISIFGLGFLAKNYADKLDRRKSLFAIESEWKLEVFRELQRNLNLIYIYFTYQGDWRKMSPEDVSTAKRSADRLVNMNSFLWSATFSKKYRSFIQNSFVENVGAGRDFLIKANVSRHRENEDWEDDWAHRFVDENARVRRRDFVSSYDEMMAELVKDLGILNSQNL